MSRGSVFLRIVGSYLFVCLLCALALALFFDATPETFNPSLRTAFKSINDVYKNFTFTIPNIPLIDLAVSSGNTFYEIVLSFVNFLINMCNIIVMLLNAVISVVMFLVSLFVAVFDSLGRWVVKSV